MKENTKDILYMTFGFIGSLICFILVNINFFTGNTIKGMKTIQTISGAIMLVLGVLLIGTLAFSVVTHKIIIHKRAIRRKIKKISTGI